MREVRIVIPEDPASVSALLELLELAGRSMHSIGYSEGLYPAQWTALRFFAKAPDGSRTASALARFQGFANGPVSRTVRTLISKGLLRKAEPQPAGRAEHLVITDNARSLLDHDPTAAIAKAMQGLSEPERVALEHALKAVIKTASGVWPRDAKAEPSTKG
jgi:DNA-binding MarR family transcriptional regulator